MELIKSSLINNHYPLDFIEKFSNIRLNSSEKPVEKLKVDTVEQLNICVLYIDQVSQKIQKSLQKHDIKTVFKNQRKNETNFNKLKGTSQQNG